MNLFQLPIINQPIISQTVVDSFPKTPAQLKEGLTSPQGLTLLGCAIVPNILKTKMLQENNKSTRHRASCFVCFPSLVRFALD